MVSKAKGTARVPSLLAGEARLSNLLCEDSFFSATNTPAAPQLRVVIRPSMELRIGLRRGGGHSQLNCQNSICLLERCPGTVCAPFASLTCKIFATTGQRIPGCSRSCSLQFSCLSLESSEALEVVPFVCRWFGSVALDIITSPWLVSCHRPGDISRTSGQTEGHDLEGFGRNSRETAEFVGCNSPRAAQEFLAVVANILQVRLANRAHTVPGQRSNRQMLF